MIAGLYLWSEMKLTLAPEPVIDQLQATLVLPEEMDDSRKEELIKDVRQGFQLVPGVADVFSLTEYDKAVVHVSLHKNSHLESIQFLLQHKLNEVLGYLDGFRIEGLVELSPAYRIPLLRLYLVGRSGSDIKRLSASAEGFIREKLIRIAGVGDLVFSGTVQEEVIVRPDRLRMAAARLTEADLINTLKQRDLSVLLFQDRLTGTMIKFPATDLIPGDHYITQDIRLSDVAEITGGIRYSNGRVTYQGNEAVYIDIFPEAGHSVVSTANRIRMEVEQLNEKMEFAELIIRSDQSMLISDNVQMLTFSLITVIFAVTILVFIMTRDWKRTVITGISVPVTLCCASTILTFTNTPVHIFVLGGMILGVGLVIDTPIVVTDALGRMGRQPACHAFKQIARISTNISSPLFLATITTILAYIPLIFLNPETRGLFRDQAVTLATVLFMSLGTGIFVIPLIYALIGHRHRKPAVSMISEIYEHSVRKSLRYPFIVLLAFMLISVIPILWIEEVPFDFLPAVSFSSWELSLNTAEEDQKWTGNPSLAGEFSKRLHANNDIEYRIYLNAPVSTGSDIAGLDLSANLRPSANPISSLFPRHLSAGMYRLYMNDSIEEILEATGISVPVDTTWELHPDPFLWRYLKIETQSGYETSAIPGVRFKPEGNPLVNAANRTILLDRVSYVVPDQRFRREWEDRHGKFIPVALGANAQERIDELQALGLIIRSGTGQVQESIYESATMSVIFTLLSIWLVLTWKFRSVGWALIVMAIFPLSISGSLYGILIFR